MLLPIFDDRPRTGTDALLKTLSTRAAGGGRMEVSTEPPRVVIDMREFRSTLPSLLHAAGQLVVPATLTVGDYVLGPDVVVERKSIPDLVQSFASGRLYAQCELMSAHYKQPVLLIEFEEHKAFALESVGELKSYTKPTGKYPPKKGAAPPQGALSAAHQGVQSKLVLLLLAFPRVRVIWSSSPYASAEIFADLKRDAREPDAAAAIAVGADADGAAPGAGNAAGEDLLRALPGVGARGAPLVMAKVNSVRELCEMSLAQVRAILGAEAGKKCYDFLHKGDR
jgi:DNA excision repair protein ERCC-4